jgi:hypothetical protein
MRRVTVVLDIVLVDHKVIGTIKDVIDVTRDDTVEIDGNESRTEQILDLRGEDVQPIVATTEILTAVPERNDLDVRMKTLWIIGHTDESMGHGRIPLDRVIKDVHVFRTVLINR